MTDAPTAAPAVPARPLALFACAVAIVGVAAIWAGVTLIVRGPAAWMAIVAALDAVLLLRLAQWPKGAMRMGIAITVTLSTIALANYFIAAAQIGVAMGMRPAEALPRMAPELALMYARGNQGMAEIGFYVLAVVVAAVLGRR